MAFNNDAVGLFYSSTIIRPCSVPQPPLSPSITSTNYRRNRLRDEPTISTTAITSSSATMVPSFLSTKSPVVSAGTTESSLHPSSESHPQQIGASTTSPSFSSSSTATSRLVAAAASSLLQSASPLTSSPGSASSLPSLTVSSLWSSSLFTGSSTLVTRTSLSLGSSPSSSDASRSASSGPRPSFSNIVISTSSVSASSTFSSSPSFSSASPSQHLETRAWVGIAVACAAVGLIVGILAALTFLRRRSKASAELEHSDAAQGAKGSDSQARTSSPPLPPPLPVPSSPPPSSQNAVGLRTTVAAGPESLIGSEPDASMSEIDSETVSELGSLPSFTLPVVTDIDRFLPIPRSEKELISELRSLGHLVQQHVEDKYHYREVEKSADLLSETLSDLGVDGDGDEVPDAKQLAVLTLNPETRQVGLQHIISRVIFDSLSADIIMSTKDTLSLLPPSMTAMLQDMPHCEKHMGNPDAMILAFTRWRLLSVFLLNATRSERGCLVPHEAAILPKAQQLVTALNKAIGSFVDEDSLQEQEEHLQDIALECAKFGYVILSQPAAYVYRFASFNVRKEIVVCPGLDKVTDEQGVQCIAQVITGPGVHVL